MRWKLNRRDFVRDMPDGARSVNLGLFWVARCFMFCTGCIAAVVMFCAYSLCRYHLSLRVR